MRLSFKNVENMVYWVTFIYKRFGILCVGDTGIMVFKSPLPDINGNDFWNMKIGGIMH